MSSSRHTSSSSRAPASIRRLSLVYRARVPGPSLSLSSPDNSVVTEAPRRRSRRIASLAELSSPPTESVARAKKRTREDSSASVGSRSRPRYALKKPPPPASPEDSKPAAKSDGDLKPAAKTEEAFTCTICMCEPEKNEIASIDGCDHLYCFSCIDKWSQRENTCPNCKSRFCKIQRLHPTRRRGGSSSARGRNTKTVKQRDQRSDLLPNAALESIIANFASRVGRGEASRFPETGARFRFIAVGPRGARGQVPSATGSRMSAIRFEHGFFPSSFFGMGDSDDDDDRIFELMPNLMSSILRSSEFSGAPRPPRSHATNANDSTAGRDPSNPLEISDDDDDDVEVINVS